MFHANIAGSPVYLFPLKTFTRFNTCNTCDPPGLRKFIWALRLLWQQDSGSTLMASVPACRLGHLHSYVHGPAKIQKSAAQTADNLRDVALGVRNGFGGAEKSVLCLDASPADVLAQPGPSTHRQSPANTVVVALLCQVARLNIVITISRARAPTHQQSCMQPRSKEKTHTHLRGCHGSPSSCSAAPRP